MTMFTRPLDTHEVAEASWNPPRLPREGDGGGNSGVAPRVGVRGNGDGSG